MSLAAMETVALDGVPMLYPAAGWRVTVTFSVPSLSSSSAGSSGRATEVWPAGSTMEPGSRL